MLEECPLRSGADGFLFVENERREWIMPIPLPLKHARLFRFAYDGQQH